MCKLLIFNRDIMTPREKLAVAKRDDSLREVAETMMKRNIRHMPVMNGDFCEGMLSIKDVVGEVLMKQKKDTEDLVDIFTNKFNITPP